MPKEIPLVLFLVLLDFAATLVVTAHGSDWDSLGARLQDKYVATTCFDFLLLTILRAAVLLGALIGLTKNPVNGRARLSKLSDNAYALGVCVTIYLCIKLLIFSEESTFMASDPDFKWFWINFASSIILTLIDLYFIGKLANAKTHSSVVEVPSRDDAVNERSPLLQQRGNDAAISINSATLPAKSPNKGSKKKDNKDSEKKSFSQLANKVTIGKMLSYSKQDVWLIIPAILFLLAAAVAEAFIPLFTGRVISGIAIQKDYAAFTRNIIIMGVITIAAAVFAGCRGGLMVLAIARFNIRIRNYLFKSLTRQDISFYDATKTGDILSRLTSDTSTMSDMIGLNCNIFLRSMVKGIGTCIFMFILSWRLSVGSFLGLPLVVGLSKLYGSYYKRLQKQVQDSFASANEVAEEVVSTMRTVRSFANENGEKDRYRHKMDDVYSVKKKQALAYAGYVSSTEIAELALVTGTLWYGGHLVMNNFMQSQNLISFILYQLTLGDCMSNIGSVYTGLMQALGASEKVFELIERKPEINLDSGDLKPDQFTGHIQFDNVSFSYPSRPDQPVLKNLSFIALPGQVTALVGPSGGGKTTCVNLLQYFYQTSGGAVRIDGAPIEKFSHKYIHQKVSLVGQEPVLYARSIRENIAYGLEESQYHDTDIVDAARKSNAHTFITSLADEYETECGEKGTQLSGGQKQRIAIARALIRNPRILILDEATSALDTESEFLVQQALQQTMKNRTVIVIAHRLSTVESADKIVVIDKGCVLEEGTHSELMKQSGMYYKLVHRQLHNHNHKTDSEDELSGTSSRNQQKHHMQTNVQSPPNGGILSRSIASSFGSEKSVIYDSDEMNV